MRTKTLRPIHANRGVESKYRATLQKLINEMVKSTEYWLTAAYRKDPPRLATDATPAELINKRIEELSDMWIRRFEEAAPKIAELYAKRMFNATDRAFTSALKEAGISVEFKMTPAMRDALEAVIAENVGLIKSIPTEYLQDVQGMVMRHYSTGRDLAAMVKALAKLRPDRAELIARDQSNKANAVVNKARRAELGITKVMWHHSHAGKTPRKSHEAADGKIYDNEQGCLIDGEYIQPGEKINCRCTGRAVLPI